MTIEQERICLFRDEQAEKKHIADIAQQKVNVEKAVYLFGELDLKPIQDEEFNYFLSGGEDWILQRWKSSVVIPPGLHKNFNREKYLDFLDRPDWSAVVAALSNCNMLRQGLFSLKDGKILIDEAIANQYIEQSNIYLQDDEQHIYSKLLQLRRLLYEFDFFRHDGNSRLTLPINLQPTGLKFEPFREGEDSYQFDAQTLKEFLRKFM